MSVSLPLLFGLMSHPFINEPLVNSSAGTERDEGVPEDVVSTKDRPFASGECAFEMIVGLIRRYRCWPCPLRFASDHRGVLAKQLLSAWMDREPIFED